jgi:sulfatase modifying factor 1
LKHTYAGAIVILENEFTCQRFYSGKCDYLLTIFGMIGKIQNGDYRFSLHKGGMMKSRLSIGTLALMLLSLILSGCISDPYAPVDESSAPETIAAGTATGLWLSPNSVGFTMIFVPRKYVLGIPYSKLEIGYVKVNVSFWISETEVTYEQWKTVYDWAIEHGYAFENPGTLGDGSGILDQKHPVTMINHRDAIIWCNALTEYNRQADLDFECVYYSDAKLTIPLRDSKSGEYSKKENTAPGSFDRPFVKTNAGGFRLPGYDEWSLAAQYVTDLDNDGNLNKFGAEEGYGPFPNTIKELQDRPIMTPIEFYPPHFASGAYTSAVDELDNVAWYPENSGNHTHAVKGKRPNALGLYDMTGNIAEWCFAQKGVFAASEAARGGDWQYAKGETATISRRTCIYSDSWAPSYYVSNSIGFRIARTK